MRATTVTSGKRSARCSRCGAPLGNADVTVCPVRCDIADPRRHFALFQAMPLGLALLFVVFYPIHLHAAFGVVAGLNLVGVALAIKDGAVVSKGGIVDRPKHPAFFWTFVALFALPSIGFFVFLALVYG